MPLILDIHNLLSTFSSASSAVPAWRRCSMTIVQWTNVWINISDIPVQVPYKARGEIILEKNEYGVWEVYETTENNSYVLREYWTCNKGEEIILESDKWSVSAVIQYWLIKRKLHLYSNAILTPYSPSLHVPFLSCFVVSTPQIVQGKGLIVK